MMRKRNKYDLSHSVLLTGNMGYLYPIASYEVLPGDSIKARSMLLVRCNPMVTPPMHPTHMSVRNFYVPYRLIFDQYEDFFTGGKDGEDDVLMPQISTDVPEGSLLNYFGIPPTKKKILINAMFVRAYNAIWNEYFRDHDLQDEIALDSLQLLKVNVEKDYFTTARPTPQKGSAVSLPITVTSDIPRLNVQPTTTAGDASTYLATGGQVMAQNGTGNQLPLKFEVQPSSVTNQFIDGTASISINDMAEAVAIQKWKEKNNIYGNSYKDVLARLGVNCPDGRLQNPEYLGGGRNTILFSEIVNTGDSQDSPIGTLKGHGIGSARSNGFRKYFLEHGVVITLAFIRPTNIYSNAMPRHFLKRTRIDYWNQELEQIGQQAIYNAEIDAIHSDFDTKGVFGWTSKYQEYRKSHSYVAGKFSYGGTYNTWHFAREFAKMPVLNSDFIESNPTNRPFAVTSPDEHHFLIMGANQIKARRLVGRPKVTTL